MTTKANQICPNRGRAELLKAGLMEVYSESEGDSEWTLERCQEALRRVCLRAKEELDKDDWAMREGAYDCGRRDRADPRRGDTFRGPDDLA